MCGWGFGMRFRNSLIYIAVLVYLWIVPQLSAALPGYHVAGADEETWGKILGSVGIRPAGEKTASIVIAGPTAGVDTFALKPGRILIVEGDSPAARQLGFVAQTERVAVRQIVDKHAPRTQIIWEQSVTIPSFKVPPGFQVFASERWKGAPVLAGKLTEQGAILWVATLPGINGTERYPYLLQALVDLGVSFPAKAHDLWAFFDSSYRLRADLDYLAARWRKSGIAVLHVAAWHNMEPDPERDKYLAKLIEACHRNAILVYAWFELPHVSERFWENHPEWREKTAAGQDAHLDWRKLMNLQNADCKKAVATEVQGLLRRFDWDGVNVAELYFESLEGVSNPARFTPMNQDVRRMFQEQRGLDPVELFDAKSTEQSRAESLRSFLDFRAALAAKMQAEWLAVMEQLRAEKPHLDIVLTHVDDRFDRGMRDALGADVARTLPLTEKRGYTFLVEDPATIWHLGAERYAKLAEKYEPIVSRRDLLAVDLNIVERYQDVYPTKKQTGVELFQLVHQAASSFEQVALYFENSLDRQDLALLPAAASQATVAQPSVDALDVDARKPVQVSWHGAVELDGRLWPVQSDTSVFVPKGKHRLSPGFAKLPVRVVDFNGQIRTAAVTKDGVEIAYTSQSRAILKIDVPVTSIEVDGMPRRKAGPDERTLLLPQGQHVVTLRQ